MKCKILRDFSNKHDPTEDYTVGSIVEFDEKRIREIQEYDASLIKVLKEDKNGRSSKDSNEKTKG